MEVAMNHDTRSSNGSEIDSDLEDNAVETGLKTQKPRHQFSGVNVPSLTKTDNNVEEPSDYNTYLHKYGGAIEDLNIQKAMNSVQYDTNNGETETKTEIAINDGRKVTKAKSEQAAVEQIMEEEEVVELEFVKAIQPKLHTHTMHCPECHQQITKVVLRRKTIRWEPPVTEEPQEPIRWEPPVTEEPQEPIRWEPPVTEEPQEPIRWEPPVTEEPQEPVDLLGCLSCLSVFTSTDNGGLKLFPIFGNKPVQADGNGVLREDGNCLSIFRVFRGAKESKQPIPENIYQDSKQPNLGKLNNQSPIQQGDNRRPDAKGELSEQKDQPPVNDGVLSHGQDDSIINIGPTISNETRDPPRGSVGQDSRSFEILKSIVYGGLMEVITSLSVVASAAAGDATTLSIIALSMANLIGGVFVIGHNLWDLKDDCYKYSTQQTSNDQEARNKYKELLGSVAHFPLHAFFAILSFLVFGIIPPVVYGYAFHETNDKDFTMLVVAVASLVCVGLLAIFKAYIDRCTGFAGYVKTITYYLTTAVAVSGVSYAVGDLVERLIEELGLFETGSNVAMAVLPDVGSMNPSLAYY